jgi:hypothetical protein
LVREFEDYVKQQQQQNAEDDEEAGGKAKAK